MWWGGVGVGGAGPAQADISYTQKRRGLWYVWRGLCQVMVSSGVVILSCTFIDLLQVNAEIIYENNTVNRHLKLLSFPCFYLQFLLWRPGFFNAHKTHDFLGHRCRSVNDLILINPPWCWRSILLWQSIPPWKRRKEKCIIYGLHKSPNCPNQEVLSINPSCCSSAGCRCVLSQHWECLISGWTLDIDRGVSIPDQSSKHINRLLRIGFNRHCHNVSTLYPPPSMYTRACHHIVHLPTLFITLGTFFTLLDSCFSISVLWCCVLLWRC